MKLTQKLFILFCSISITPVFAALATGPDFILEQQWQQQLIDTVVVGDVIELKDHQQRSFVALHTPSEGEHLGTVILLHNMGGHANWPAVIGPLRRTLPSHGWATLSLQMPVLGSECGGREHAILLKDSPGRIDAALSYLEQQGERRIILFGHGLGAVMSAAYLLEHPAHSFEGVILAGLYHQLYTDPRMDVTSYMDKLQLPILDVFGRYDIKVSRAKDARALSVAIGGNKDYRQVEIDKADIFFEDREDELLEQIVRWLSRWD